MKIVSNLKMVFESISEKPFSQQELLNRKLHLAHAKLTTAVDLSNIFALFSIVNREKFYTRIKLVSNYKISLDCFLVFHSRSEYQPRRSQLKPSNSFYYCRLTSCSSNCFSQDCDHVHHATS